MNEDIVEAIENKKLIEFLYDGESRIVEPHCYGVTTKGNDAIRAFQVDGYSSSGKMGWKLYDLSKVDDLNISGKTFYSPRPGYKKGDRGMDDIYCEL